MIQNNFRLLATILVAVSLGTVYSERLTNAEYLKKFNLNFIGAVEDKAFFAEANNTMNWVAGSNLCTSAGMQLAAVENADEATFLRTNLYLHYTEWWFWTAARERRNYAGFMWNTTGDVPPEAVFNDIWIEYPATQPFHYCAAISSVSTRLRMMTLLCSATNMGVLCEADTSIEESQ